MSDATTADLPLESNESPRRGGRIAAAVVAVVALVGGLLFAINALGGDDNKPEDAVRAMLDAAAKEDVLGVLAQLDPGERDAIQPGLTSLVHELDRLGVLDNASLAHVSGVDLSIDGVATATKNVNDHIAQVRVTKGTASYAVTADKLPLGDFVRKLLGDKLAGTTSKGHDTLEQSSNSTGFTTVKRGGRWYVSIGYSAAESARESAGIAIGDVKGIDAKGASSPEQAVRDLVTAAAGLDVRRLVELLPPGELSAVHDYAGLFLDDAEKAASDGRKSFKADVTNLKLRTSKDGDEALVSLVSADAAVDVDGKPVFGFKDGCVTIDTDGTPKKVCKNDDPKSLLDQYGLGAALGGLTPPKLSVGKPDLGLVTVQVNGSWYVSPTRTVLRNLVATLKVVDRADLDAIRTYVTSVLGVAMKTVTQSLGSSSSVTAVPAD